MLTQEGNTYIKLHKNAEASEAFKKAAASSPGGPAAYNLCVVNYNSGNAQEGIPACENAITADPKNANAYFLKGSLMMQQSKQGKDGKLEAPDGTAEALNKYLELEPDGPHANDAKQMLQFIGAKIQTTYKAGKKK
jgi:tetratricopeptide (TPR) repeat protein